MHSVNNRTLRVSWCMHTHIAQCSIEGTNSMIPIFFISLIWNGLRSSSSFAFECIECFVVVVAWRQRYGTSLNYCCTCSPNRWFVNYIQQMHTFMRLAAWHCCRFCIHLLFWFAFSLFPSISSFVCAYIAPCIWTIMRTIVVRKFLRLFLFPFLYE